MCSEWTSGGPRRPDGFPRAPVAPAARRSRPRRSGSWLCLPSSLSRVWAAPAPGPPAAYSIPRVTWPPGLLQVSGGDGARRSGCGMAESPGTATALRPAGRVRSAKPFQRDEEGSQPFRLPKGEQVSHCSPRASCGGAVTSNTKRRFIKSAVRFSKHISPRTRQRL